jgi:DNA polymerase III subunit beta
MKFTISREHLIRPLQMVNGIVERRQTLPILSNLLVRVADQELSLTSTDLEIEMLTQVAATKGQPGETTLPARKFLDICRSLADDATIEVAVSAERATIRSGKSRFVLSTLPATEFPAIEVDRDATQFSLPQHHFREAIGRTHFAMAQQDVRYYLNGMLMEVERSNVRLVATDGHRLALAEVKSHKKIDSKQSVIIPRKAIQELMRLLGDDEHEAEIRISSNFVQVNTPEMRFTSKLIDGRFPDYQNVIPSGGNKAAVCDRQGLSQALNRVSILSNEKYRGVRLQFSDNVLRITAHNPEQEEAEEEIEVKYTGEALEIGFNVNYLLDALSAEDTNEVRLTMLDANSSCLIQGIGETSSKHIVMPIRL